MAGYKVIQDIEAEDKLVGPLSLRQFIYAAIAALLGYLSLTALTHGLSLLLIVLLPPMLFAGFFAVPWGSDQPTEVWALAKIRFYLKSRKRLWDQSGVKELVTVTVPKKIIRSYTNNLSIPEVESRLSALASTLDTRGWATKNVYTYIPPANTPADPDRLLDAAALPKDIPDTDIRADEDMLDEMNNPRAQRLSQMVTASTASYKQRLMNKMQETSSAAHGTGILPPIVSTTATADEAALANELKKRKAQTQDITAHQHIVQPLAFVPPPRMPLAAIPSAPATVTPPVDPATIRLAQNDDLTISTIARIANRQDQDSEEVVIPLHRRS